MMLIGLAYSFKYLRSSTNPILIYNECRCIRKWLYIKDNFGVKVSLSL